MCGVEVTEDIDKQIKLIASTSEAFSKMEAFRTSLPIGCKDQIESIGAGFAGFEITYRETWDKPVIVPKGPRQIKYDENWMRLYYDGKHVMVPFKGKPIEIQFVGDEPT